MNNAITRRNRETGTLVTVDLVESEGLDPAEGGKWMSFCEDHGQFVQHETKALAIALAAHPAEWCASCTASE